MGLACTAVVAALTFFAHQRLPYKKMLVLTGVLLGVVLIVMVGESAQYLRVWRTRRMATSRPTGLTPRLPSIFLRLHLYGRPAVYVFCL